MEFLHVTTTDGKTEFLNVEKIIAITPLANGNIKILMGAGLYYIVKPEITKTTLTEVLKTL